jgi:hypothetical protein
LNYDGFMERASMGTDLAGMIPVIDSWLEDLDFLPGNIGPNQPPDQFFSFTTEHAAADQLDPAAFITVKHVDPPKKLGRLESSLPKICLR